MEAVADAVRPAGPGSAHPGRPVGSFLFLGPTGVGKTELARALAEALFGSPDRLVRLDLAEYADRSAVTRLIGAPPGHVGYDEAGQLTEAVRRDPYTVLLLDEIEKAHPEVAAHAAAGARRRAAHRRARPHGGFPARHLTMTSNLGSEQILAGEDLEVVRSSWSGPSPLRPELLNRVDDVVLFTRLARPTCGASSPCSSRRRVTGCARGCRPGRGRRRHRLARGAGAPPELGARPLRRTIGARWNDAWRRCCSQAS